jgi:hypothetical protein
MLPPPDEVEDIGPLEEVEEIGEVKPEAAPALPQASWLILG